MMTGCGLKRGVVTGATDKDGVEVIEKPYDEQNLFATIFTAVAAAISAITKTVATTLGTTILVEIRGQKYQARVVPTPFYKRTK